MFICDIGRERDYGDRPLSNMINNKYSITSDIIKHKRDIILYDDVDTGRSVFDGRHTLKCVIVNSSVLNGKYNHDTPYNTDMILARTFYNCYVISSPNADVSDASITKRMLYESKVKLINAYTSYMGIWDNGSMYAPLGGSILSISDIRSYERPTSRRTISIGSCGSHYTMKIEVSFDSQNFYTVLPLPLPMFYSKIHSERHDNSPIITRSCILDYNDLIDDATTETSVSFSRVISRGKLDYYEDSDIESEVLYYDTDEKLIKKEHDIYPIHYQTAMFDSVFTSAFIDLFKNIMVRDLVSNIIIAYDSVQNDFMIMSLRFSYNLFGNKCPKNYVESVFNDIRECESLRASLRALSKSYGEFKAFINFRDLSYDVKLIFNKGFSVAGTEKVVKSVRYRSSVFDMLNKSVSYQMTNYSRPIQYF